MAVPVLDFTGDLEKDFSELPIFSYAGCSFIAKVVKVIDGDTLEIVFYESGIARRMKFRMNGYDSPEMKPLLSISDRELHKNAAYKCKVYLEKTILNKIVKVQIDAAGEKYGRLLGDIYINYVDIGLVNVNKKMIEYGCMSYVGGTKTVFTKEALEKICKNAD